MTYRKPHFLDCTCQCESKRQLLQALLDSSNRLSISKRSFLLIDPAGQGGVRPKPSHDIQYDEYQWIGVPTHTSVMGHLRGNIGDLYIDKTPGSHALYAKTSATEWKKWPGPLSITHALRHPLYPHYILWCHPSTRTISWFFDLLVNKVNLDGSAHDIIYAILQEHRGAEAYISTWNKHPVKRKYYALEEVTFQKRFKWTTNAPHNNSQVVTAIPWMPPTISVDPTSAPLEEIARLRKEAIRLKNAHTALQELVTTMHPTPSLALDRPISLQQSVSNLLGSPRQSPHSSVPDGKIITSKPGLDSSSPKPLKSDVPLSPSPRCIQDLHNEGDCNLRNSSATPVDGNFESIDTFPTTLDSRNEANGNASSSVNNHNIVKQPVMADGPHQMDALDIYKHDSPAEQETTIDSPSNDVDRITLDKPDNRDINTGNLVETVGRVCLSPLSLPSEPLEREENMSPKHQSAGNQVGEILVESASHDTTEAFRLDLHSDEARVTMAVTSNPENSSHTHCSQPFAQRMDSLLTTPNCVVKDVTPALSNGVNFRLNCSLKEIIFHVSKNLGLICRLCLGTGSSYVHSFSMDVSLEDLGDHCVKEHLQFCKVLQELSAEEIDGLNQHFSKK